MKLCRRVIVWVFVLCFGCGACAHDPGLSSANVSRTQNGLKVTLTFAWSELAGLGPEETRSAVVAVGTESPTEFSAEWAQTAGRFVRLAADGLDQSSVVPSLARSMTEPGDVVVTFEWPRVPSSALSVEFPVLEDLQYGHRMLLTIGDSTELVAMLRVRLPRWEIPAVAAPESTPTPAPAREGWTQFLVLGVEHILIGFDHLCFLLALLLVADRLRDVVALITTFTVAHSLTLAAAALGLVSLSPRLVEPLIAASIVYVAIENLILRRPPKYRLAVVFGFGLVHGLGFAGILAERLPGVTGSAVVPPLLAFNAGVELGQLAVAACIVPLIKLARAQPRLAPKLQPALSLVIAMAGAIWFFQRV
jgi:hydrogenase/urease accessory protein HupE